MTAEATLQGVDQQVVLGSYQYDVAGIDERSRRILDSLIDRPTFWIIRGHAPAENQPAVYVLPHFAEDLNNAQRIFPLVEP